MSGHKPSRFYRFLLHLATVAAALIVAGAFLSIIWAAKTFIGDWAALVVTFLAVPLAAAALMTWMEED